MSVAQRLARTRVTFDNILLPTDFSQQAQAAFPHALALARHYGSELHLVHVLPESLILMRTRDRDPVIFESDYQGQYRRALERMKLLSSQVTDVSHNHIYVRRGKIWDVIWEIVTSQSIDLLVLGTHGRTGMGKLVLGSVAEQVLRQSSRPVMTVGPKARIEHEFDVSQKDIRSVPIGFRHILVALDFSEESLTALDVGVALAEEFETKLGLLHVIEPGQPTSSKIVLSRLESSIEEPARLWCKPASMIQFGSPAECILETAAECDSDLIVMGVRKRRAPLFSVTHFPWNTAHRVIADAHCPVLTVRDVDQNCLVRERRLR